MAIDTLIARSPDVRGWFKKLTPKGGDQPPPKSPAEPPTEPEFEGVITDSRLVRHFYKLQGHDVDPIATDKFLNKSKAAYNESWLSREIVQNFVDANEAHRGTLDGVGFTSQQQPDGTILFIIKGNWPFKDSTGITHLDSNKTDDIQTAGGNGIGLKQVAIRFLRDFGVETFEIQGEGWTVNYELAKAADINQKWSSRPDIVPRYQVEHDWLLADIKNSQNAGSCAYVIKTGNPQVIDALKQLPYLGVSEKNPYLQNLDYKNEFGAIKWLPKGTSPSESRLFVNGQVMNYQDTGKTAQDYWRGPGVVTIQLNNLSYQMSIDRPPISPYILSNYIGKFVEKMSKDDLTGQIKQSEYLWAGSTDSSSAAYRGYRDGAFVVVEKMVDKLFYQTRYQKEQFKEVFGDKKYLAWDNISEQQARELEEKGYILCPDYFAKIGMAKASAELKSAETVSDQKPKSNSYEMMKIAQECGISVGYEDLSEIKTPQDFFQIIKNGLAGRNTTIEERKKPNTVRIKLNGKIDEDLLFHPLLKPRTDDQKFVHFLRGVALYGLDSNIFKDIYTSQGEYVTTFSVDEDYVADEKILMARNINNPNNEGVFMEIELDEKYYAEFLAAMKGTASNPTTQHEEKPQSTDESTQDAPQIGEKGITSSETEAQQNLDVVTGKLLEGKQWTEEEERLYREAIKRNPQDLSEAEKAVIAKRQRLAQEFEAINIEQPEKPDLQKKGETVEKEVQMSEAEKARLAQIETLLPGITQTVNQLDTLIPRHTIEESPEESPFKKYLEWRNSPDFYGKLGDNSQYLNGRHLLDILNEQDQAEIPTLNATRSESPGPTETIMSALKSKLESIASRMATDEGHTVDEFELVTQPTENQLAQLGLLRMYAQIGTGVALPNDLFIYKGTGSKGINLGQKAIGLHESLFTVQFSEAARTFTHEIAHNEPDPDGPHENLFRHTMESLFAATIDRVTTIATKQATGQSITQEDTILIDIRQQWEQIRQAA